MTHQDCEERYHVGKDVRKQVECVSKDCNRVSVIPPQNLDHHKEQGDHCDALEFRYHDLICRFHRILCYQFSLKRVQLVNSPQRL